jgi:hypothetical protein
MLAKVFSDLLTNASLLFLSSFLSLLNMWIAFYLFFEYNRFIYDFDLFAKDETDHLKRLT